MPPLHNVEDDDSSEPVFRLLLGEEETKAVMKESALETDSMSRRRMASKKAAVQSSL